MFGIQFPKAANRAMVRPRPAWFFWGNSTMLIRTSGGIVEAIQRGIAGHLTFVAASAGWGMTSELALYPPIGAIFHARGWLARCQWPLQPPNPGTRGAPKTIDFIARAPQKSPPIQTRIWDLAIEIKLLTSRGSGSLDARRDIKKLKQFKLEFGSDVYLLVVGREPDLIGRRVIMADHCEVPIDISSAIIANVRKTSWGSAAIKI